MDIKIRKAELTDIELLMKWRMRVLHEVFDISDNEPAEELEWANRNYYQSALQAGGHIACFACQGGEIIGCGGICLYQEMPSPDNHSGQCAYLMNIYTCPEFRGRGVGEMIVRWLVGQAVQRNITKIYLETSKPGRKLYEKTGFLDMPDMMKLQTIKSDST
ncbi:MAG: GNAT family N-acetyltransferase [Lachnospiraceae bacterium]|nr:GNAT family N-acetyltransferase [Lachnospiraceae bacterium]